MAYAIRKVANGSWNVVYANVTEGPTWELNIDNICLSYEKVMLMYVVINGIIWWTNTNFVVAMSV